MRVVGSSSVARRQARAGERRQADVARPAGCLAEVTRPAFGAAPIDAGDFWDAFPVVRDVDTCALGFARVAVGDTIYSANRRVDFRCVAPLGTEHIRLAATGSKRDAELRNVVIGAGGLAVVSSFEVVVVATATAPRELLALTGIGVVEPPRDRGVAGAYHGRGETWVIDHATLPSTTLLVAVAADPHTIGGLLLGPVDTDLVGLALLALALLDGQTLALLTDEPGCAVDQSTGVIPAHSVVHDPDVDAPRLAGVDVGSTVGSADRFEDSYARTTTWDGNTNVCVTLVTRKAVAWRAAAHRGVAFAPMRHLVIALGCLFDRVCATVGTAYEAFETLDVAALTATNRAHQQGACKPKTLHFDSPLRIPGVLKYATRMPVKSAEK